MKQNKDENKQTNKKRLEGFLLWISLEKLEALFYLVTWSRKDVIWTMSALSHFHFLVWSSFVNFSFFVSFTILPQIKASQSWHLARTRLCEELT